MLTQCCLAALVSVQECRDLKCLLHLPAWPKLQALLLNGVRPTYIEIEQLALLQAAPCLRRLAFSSSVRSNDEQQRMEVRRPAACLLIVAGNLP